uniref:Uncharacterized protein n=1 Tax=Wuchereria bancrofti TaxID=6293 RepID=A0AAF5PVX4_WUCBA
MASTYPESLDVLISATLRKLDPHENCHELLSSRQYGPDNCQPPNQCLIRVRIGDLCRASTELLSIPYP